MAYLEKAAARAVYSDLLRHEVPPAVRPRLLVAVREAAERLAGSPRTTLSAPLEYAALAGCSEPAPNRRLVARA
ncbi:hypothetical protein AB0N17_46885, partial [Streptomyces sp. NPDC051133]|uniref:hypothetical protein n=1 Tax=Streptomyces sp. NPDC051133 TaxID=3155521 RepID=UPI0034198573